MRSMNLEPVTQSEVGQKEKNECHLLGICMESRKIVLMNLFTEKKQRCRQREWTRGHIEGRREWDIFRK